MTQGLVSIIVPTYNRAAYVVEALYSAQAQTYPLKQIIVVDDGSSDNTAAMVSKIEGVEYYRQSHSGQGAARNYGLCLARGEYVASLDSDDLWDEDFLTRSVECLEAYQLDFTFTNWTKVRGNQCQPSEWLRDGKWRRYQTRHQGEWWLLAPAEVRDLFLKICPAPSSSLVVRRSSILSGWGEHMRIADEWYMLLEMVLRRPCWAAFNLTPRWKKRVDGANVYDGRPFVEAAKELHLHDYPAFRRDFNSLLTRREKIMLTRREAAYRLRFLLHSAKAHLDERVTLPGIINRLGSPSVTFVDNPGRKDGNAGDN